MNELVWRKSKRSTTEAQCVEVAWPHGGAAVRDSKNADGPRIAVGAAAWAAWVEVVKRGDL